VGGVARLGPVRPPQGYVRKLNLSHLDGAVGAQLEGRTLPAGGYGIRPGLENDLLLGAQMPAEEDDILLTFSLQQRHLILNYQFASRPGDRAPPAVEALVLRRRVEADATTAGIEGVDGHGN
jgi:hypothetical protein